MAASSRPIHEKIQILKAAAEDLAAAGGDIPTVVRNTARILASVRMLEMGISDLFELGILDNASGDGRPAG
ncbi:MAG: hypothetical protein K9L59_06485 [Desulfobacterales bacterium]|nr:hypothetical protein [Desulfobacterales bacterium]